MKATAWAPAAAPLAVAWLLQAGPALAACPVGRPEVAQFGEAGQRVVGTCASDDPTTLIGGLPFTGLDLIALAALTLSLLIFGAVLRRLGPIRR